MSITDLEKIAAWESVQALLREQLTAPSFETWISPLKVTSLQADKIVLETGSTFNRDWILKNYKESIAKAFAGILELSALPQIAIEITQPDVPPSDAAEEGATQDKMNAAPATKRPWAPKNKGETLNPKYTFDQFVVGNHNRFCHAAALAVAETPAQSYNPLFVYGGVGLGKTHLMHAIGHFAHLHHPDYKVKYVTTEQFTNDLITALGSQDMKNFRDRYRRIDILMIDDVQFLEGKDRTQEEIFHTFNTLHQAGKQIIISSDRPPNRLSRLEDRLRSRFSWGLIADIQAPDFETRVAILQRKAQRLELQLDNDVVQYIAESFPTNIRELEGALNKISAFKMLTGYAIDLVQAQALLGRRFDPSRISKEDMIETVAHYYHLQRSDLQSNLRTKHIACARQVAIYVIRELTEASFPQIGQIFGGRRHTTMLYAYEKMKELVAADPTLRTQVQEIMDLVKSKASNN